MAEITPCPSCAKQNRMPSAASGKPACGACRAPLPWIVDATDGSFDDAIATTVPVLVDLWAGALPSHALTDRLDAHAPEAA